MPILVWGRETDMRRKITLAILIVACFLLQTTIFQTLSIASIAPNLMIVLTSCVGFMRGKTEGMITGFVSGLLIDILSGSVPGCYALVYMLCGYVNGIFAKRFYPENLKLPVLSILLSDLYVSMVTWMIMFAMRGRGGFFWYAGHIILPEMVYTAIVSVALYLILLGLDRHLENIEKRSAAKFV